MEELFHLAMLPARPSDAWTALRPYRRTSSPALAGPAGPWSPPVAPPRLLLPAEGLRAQEEADEGTGETALLRLRAGLPPTPGSPLGGRDLSAFVADADGAFNYAQPLAARRGVVLMRLAPRTCFERTATAGGLLVGLCNPVTGERHVAPPLESCACLGRHVNGYAILTAADTGGDDVDGDHLRRPPPGRVASSRLLLTGLHQDDRHLYLHPYYASTRGWSGPTACLHGDKFRMAGAAVAVVHRGAPHWLYFDLYALYALSAEVGMGTAAARVSLTKIPVDVGGWPYLCVTGDGRLSIVSVRATRVEVWTRQDGDDGGDPAAWLQTRHVIQIPPAQPVPECPSLLQNRYWFHFDKGAMVVVYNGDGAFVVDIEREVVEKVMDCSLSIGYFSCVPYEMDLPEFFVLQLGRQYSIEADVHH